MSRTTPPTRRIYISSFSHQREEKTKKFYSHQGNSNRVMDTYHPIPQIFQKHVELTISPFFYLIAALYLICLAPSLVRHHHHHRVVCSCCCMYHTAPCSFLPKRKKRGAYDGHGGSAAFSIQRGGHTLTVEQIASSCCPGGWYTSWKRREERG